MAVINVRVDDRIRDQLKDLADDGGMTLSEYIRDLLMEAVVPIQGKEAIDSEEPAPKSMRVIDRQVLSLLHRILGRVLPKDADDVDGDLEYQLMRARILEEGYTREYWYETTGIKTELSRRDCDRVLAILQMFRIITFSIDSLVEKGVDLNKTLTHRLEFRGFDHNDTIEGHMAAYVGFLVHEDLWAELKPQLQRHDNGNSHSPILSTYLRMLTEYRRIIDGRNHGDSASNYLLSIAELERISEASVHPSHRHSAVGSSPSNGVAVDALS